MIALVTVLGWFVRTIFGPMNLDMFYLLIVVMSAVKWGRGPALMTSVVSVLIFNHFFVPPYLASLGFDLQSSFVLIGFLVVGFVISELTSKTRSQAIKARERGEQATMLYRLSKDLAASDSFDEVLLILRTKIGEIFNCHVAVFLLADHHLDLVSVDSEFLLSEHEKAIAGWVLKNGQPAGMCTAVFNESKAHYLPLKTSQETFGVLGISFREDQAACASKDNDLLDMLANQAAIAIQRTKLAEVSRQIELLRETERLQTALLNSISHDLKTPLVSIMGVLDSLLHDFSALDQQTRKELLATAYEDSDHLNRLVSNLLDMTRLEAKALKIRIEPCELRDVIGVSLQELKEKLNHRSMDIQIPQDLPEITVDFSLMVKVFVNLIDNAAKYSSEESPIHISARVEDHRIRIEIVDEGAGVPEKDLNRIFDKFYRVVSPDQIKGIGLGLSISKGIVEAHHGKIWAENSAKKKGTKLVVLLPYLQPTSL